MTHLKTTFIGLAIVAGSAFLTSCSKEKNKPITEEDSVELIEGSLQGSSAGLEELVSNYSEVLVTNYAINSNCGQNYDTTYNFNYSGAFAQAAYSINWGYALNCSMGIPSTAQLNASSSGTYSTNRMTSDDNTSANLNISGLQPSFSNLVFSGDLSRTGYQTITINSNTREISSTITLTLTNLVVSKSTYEIESGTGSAILVADNGADTFNFSGDIVFHGGGSATLTINGNSYTISL